jgi:LPS-assembly lipoprotein
MTSPVAPSCGRRTALWLGMASAAVWLSGCGFQLRGSGVQMAFGRLRLEGGVGAGLALQLSDQLKASGVEVQRHTTGPAATGPASGAGPEVVLTVLQDQRERVVVGSTAAGQVRELVLRQRLRYRLRTASGRDLIALDEIVQERELSFNETQVLGKEAEEALLYTDIQNAVVRQLMYRLAAVRL